jgi:UDP-N-acetylmuramate dehydrogenase
VVLSATYALPSVGMSAPVRYAELARMLGVEIGERAPVADVAAAVVELRRGKGMVLDADDHDTWSAGSFFTNPVLSPEAARCLPEVAPRFPMHDGRVKTSAAWLIQHAGFGRGFRVRPDSPASLSTKHTLAVTNRGGATAADILELARVVRDGVARSFDVDLAPEPVLVGCAL